MKIFISGMPRCGKTTLILELIKNLRAKNKKIAGIITPELRKGKIRQGFAIKDLASNKQAVLASTEQKTGPQVSKYKVNVEAINKIVKEAEKSFDKADIIVIDEIGKMELFSEAFKQMLSMLLTSDKTIIATVHRAYYDSYKNKGIFIWLEKNELEEVKLQILKSLEKSENF